MAAKPITKAVQDLPPPGGYPPIDFKKRVGPRGPSGFALWGGVIALTAYGFWQIGNTNAVKRHNIKEKREGRMAIMPYLMTEEAAHRKIERDAAYAYEAKVMKDVKGWVVGESVYSGKKYLPPTNGISNY